MTNQEVLEKAITKAIEGGWTEYGVLKEVRQPIILLDGTVLVTMEGDMHDDTYDNFTRQFNYEAIIYNKNFAKALWGEEDTEFVATPDWQYRLQQMVIADDPIKYLGDNI